MWFNGPSPAQPFWRACTAVQMRRAWDEVGRAKLRNLGWHLRLAPSCAVCA